MSRFKGLRWGLAVVALVALTIAATASAAGAVSGSQAVTVGGVSPEKPSVSGNRVVWSDYRHGQWDIWLYDAGSGKSEQITSGPGDKLQPSISGDIVAYVKYSGTNTGADVYTYDCVTKQSSGLSTLLGDQINPVVNGTRVAWVDASLSLPKIIVYNFSGGTYTTVPSAYPVMNSFGRNGTGRPSLWGDWVAYEEQAGTGNYNISAYNFVTTERVRVAGEAGSEVMPAIAGNTIAYVTLGGPTGSDISTFDLGTRQTSVATNRVGEQTLPTIGTGILYWVENTEGGPVVVGKSLSTGAVTALNPAATIAGYTAASDARAWLQLINGHWVVKAQFGLPVAGGGAALSLAPATPGWSALRTILSARNLDVVGPVAMYASVEPGEANVSRTGGFQVFFSEDLKASSVNASTVRIIDNATGAIVPASVTYSAVTRAAVVQPAAPLAGDSYTLEVLPTVADLSGNVADQGLAVSFSTNAGAPQSANPPNAVSNVRATVVSATVVNVSWNQGSDPDGDLVGYKIFRTYTASATPSSMVLVKTVASPSTLNATVSVAATEVATKFTMYYTVKGYDSTPQDSVSWVLDAPAPHGTYSALGGTNTCARCHSTHGGGLIGGLGALGARGAAGCYKCHGNTSQASLGGANSLNNIQAQFWDYSASPMPSDASRHGNAYIRAQADNQQCDMCHSPHKRPYSDNSAISYGDLLKRPSTVNTAVATVLSADNAPFDDILCYSCHGSGVNTASAPLGYMTVMGGTTAYDSSAGDHNQAAWDVSGTAHGSLMLTDAARPNFPNGGLQPTNACQICHDQHGSPAVSLLQYRRSTPASDGAVEQSALCFNCHSGGAAADSSRGTLKPNFTWNGRDVKGQFTGFFGSGVTTNSTGDDKWSAHTYTAQQRLYSSSTSDAAFTGYTLTSVAENPAGILALTAGSLTGNAVSPAITIPGTVNRWISATVTGTIPSLTTCTVEILDNANTVIAGIPGTPAPLSAGKNSVTVPLLTVNPVVYPTIKVRVNFTRAGTASTQTIDAVRVDWQATNTFSAASLTCYNCHNTHYVGRGNSGAAWEETRYSDPYDTNVTNNTLATTDFCIRCHQSVAAANFPGARFASAARLTPYPVAFQSITATFFPAWDKSTFTTAGHYTTGGTKALCENCHDPHGSNNARLAAWTNPAAYVKITGTRDNTSTEGSESNLCFNCHGWDANAVGGYTGATAVTGAANVRLNVAQPMASSYGHTSTIIGLSDRHSDEETGGDLIGATNRHAECVDCHEPHEAQAGTHTAGSSAAGAVLKGVRAVVPAYTAATTWTAPVSWTATTLGSGKSYEGYLCLKCHSSYLPNWATQAPASPSLPGSIPAETDLALEFNPNNASGHSVLGSDSAGLVWPKAFTASGVTWAAATTLELSTTTGYTSSSKMTCTDCHTYSGTAARGPHGATNRFMLRWGGTNLWYQQVPGATGASWNATTNFCAGCHYRNSHLAWMNQQSQHQNASCEACHTRIPHGWKRPRLIVRHGFPSIDATPYVQGGSGGLRIVNRTAKTETWAGNTSDCGASGTSPNGQTCSSHSDPTTAW